MCSCGAGTEEKCGRQVLHEAKEFVAESVFNNMEYCDILQIHAVVWSRNDTAQFFVKI